MVDDYTLGRAGVNTGSVMNEIGRSTVQGSQQTLYYGRKRSRGNSSPGLINGWLLNPAVLNPAHPATAVEFARKRTTNWLMQRLFRWGWFGVAVAITVYIGTASIVQNMPISVMASGWGAAFLCVLIAIWAPGRIIILASLPRISGHFAGLRQAWPKRYVRAFFRLMAIVLLSALSLAAFSAIMYYGFLFARTVSRWAEDFVWAL